MIVDPSADDRLDRAFMALADPVRRRMIARLSYTAVTSQSDSTGNVGLSSPRTFTVDTAAPTGNLTAPATNANVRGAR